VQPLPVEEQDAAIRRLFPAFRQTCALDFVSVWRGPVRPIAKTYEIGITYIPRTRFGGARVANPWITVEVLDPIISLDPRSTGERPPHIFPRRDIRAGWSLCLYDPRKGQWGPDRFIADTIIPWTAEWLFFFEGWLIDGQWAGGGTHPDHQEPSRRTRCPIPDPCCPDPPAPFPVAAFRRIGRLTGTFASSLSMVAASGASSPPAYSPSWSAPSNRATRS
jgi:hypothetical protein